jgi:propanol-preferring alcohol dehydrogenase
LSARAKTWPRLWRSPAKVKADFELQPLLAINGIFDRLEHGKVAGRVVLDFIGTKADAHKSKTSAAKKMEAATVG